eukprot:317103-Amphidinium_carterae.2
MGFASTPGGITMLSNWFEDEVGLHVAVNPLTHGKGKNMDVLSWAPSAAWSMEWKDFLDVSQELIVSFAQL